MTYNSFTTDTTDTINAENAEANVLDNTNKQASEKDTSRYSDNAEATALEAQDSETKDSSTTETKESKSTPDATAIAMSKVFNSASDLSIAIAKLTEPVSKVYLQDGKVFVENESSDNKLIEHLGIRLPEYLKLSEATALFQTELPSLNDFLDTHITKYLNDRGLNITSIVRDKTGKFLLSDGTDSYKLEDIKNYINNSQSMSFDTVNPLTNEDLAKIKTMLDEYVKDLQKATQGILGSGAFYTLSSKAETSVIFRVGDIIKSLNIIKIGESLIKKFKEDSSKDAPDANTLLSDYYAKKYNKPRTDPQVQIQFFAYLYSDTKATKPLSNQYANKQDVSDIARDFMSRLNKKNLILEQNSKTNANKKQVSQLKFYMGDENNILIPQGKNYVAFSLICTKDDLGEKNKTNMAKTVLGGLVNTLATASGALVNADRTAALSTASPKAL